MIGIECKKNNKFNFVKKIRSGELNIKKSFYLMVICFLLNILLVGCGSSGGEENQTIEKVEAPIITPIGGNYFDSVDVTIEGKTPESIIRYTIDGTDPNENSTVYLKKFSITESSVVKAKAFKNLMISSNVKTETYVIKKDVVENLIIKKEPLKKEYYVGEKTLELDGIEVVGKYTSGKEINEDIFLSDITGFDTTTPGEKNITIMKFGKIANFKITVQENITVNLTLLRTIDILNLSEYKINIGVKNINAVKAKFTGTDLINKKDVNIINGVSAIDSILIDTSVEKIILTIYDSADNQIGNPKDVLLIKK